MKPATEILLSAAFALTPEENWTQHVYARAERGGPTHFESADACRWCVDGALIASRNALNLSHADYDMADSYLSGVLPFPMSSIRFNDTHTHAEVLDALYKAAELSEQ